MSLVYCQSSEDMWYISSHSHFFLACTVLLLIIGFDSLKMHFKWWDCIELDCLLSCSFFYIFAFFLFCVYLTLLPHCEIPEFKNRLFLYSVQFFLKSMRYGLNK